MLFLRAFLTRSSGFSVLTSWLLPLLSGVHLVIASSCYQCGVCGGTVAYELGPSCL